MNIESLNLLKKYIEERLAELNAEVTYLDSCEYRREGAISELERLLEQLETL